MLGLDYAGKTTILFKIKSGEIAQTIPCIGINIESIKYKNCKIDSWDVGGSDSLPSLRKHICRDTEGLIFVVDSGDSSRIKNACVQLHKLLAQEELKNVPVLVLANRQDAGTMDVNEVIDKLELAILKNHPWHCQGTCAISGQGVNEGMNWLINELEAKNKPLI